MRRRTRIKLTMGILGFTVVVAAGLGLIYYGGYSYYSEHFYDNTTINGISVGKLTDEEAVEKLDRYIGDYLLTVETSRGDKENLLGPDFEYHYEDTGAVLNLLTKEQDPSRWIMDYDEDFSYEVAEDITINKDMLKTCFENLDMCDVSSMTAPTDAYVGYNEETDKYELFPETYGDTLMVDKAFTAVLEAVLNSETYVYIDDEYYEAPAVYSDNEELQAVVDKIAAYYGVSITYVLPDGSEETLDSDVIQTWLSVDDDFNVFVDEEKVDSFVQTLATKYNTYADKRNFQTTVGDTIIIGGGDYGWVVDKSAEKEQIMADLAVGGNVRREMIFEQEAKQWGENDIGSTYVEVDISNQHIYYYVDGEIVLDTDVVTGNVNRGNGTPDGVFKIVYKEKNATLVGEDYSSAVNYFMPFAYNVGFHDASWRSRFGGSIYLSGGSHGCVNMPKDKAAELFDLIEVGTPVVVYYRDEVTLTAENAQYSNAYSYVSPEEIESREEAEEDAKKAEEKKKADEAAGIVTDDNGDTIEGQSND